jgi:uncharacterized protein YqgV (UPF0045/DUF77 family)
MAYVVQDDILVYLEQVAIVGQGLSTNIKLTFYKDFVGSQLDIRKTGSLRISLFNPAGKRLLTYNYPTGYGEPISTSYLDDTKGEIEFTISKFYSSNLDLEDLYAEVIFIDEKNYFPNTKRYEFQQFKIGEVVVTDVPPLATGVTGDTLVSLFNISSITSQNPTEHGDISFNSSLPSSTTSVILNNINSNHIRLSSLENFLTKRIQTAGETGIITLINADAPTQYAVYKITGWSRINLDANGSSSDFADAIKLDLQYEATTSSPVISGLEWTIGKNVSYQLESYTEVSNIIDDVITVENSVDSIETQVIRTENSVDSIETKISTVQGSVSGVQSNLSSIETLLSGQITAILASITALTNVIVNPGDSTAPNVIPFTERNKTPNNTSGIGQPTGITISNNPAPTSYMEVNVNGVVMDVGNGLKMQWPCYFSRDGGVIPLTYAEIQTGDQLYWNSNIAGFDLENTDSIDLNYQIER